MSWFGDLTVNSSRHPQDFILHTPTSQLGTLSSYKASTTLTTQYFFRVDVAHLVLYHLSVCCKKKYFDFDREILPFTSENWDSLLLGEVRGSEALGRRVERGCTKKGGREGPLLP